MNDNYERETHPEAESAAIQITEATQSEECSSSGTNPEPALGVRFQCILDLWEKFTTCCHTHTHTHTHAKIGIDFTALKSGVISASVADTVKIEAPGREVVLISAHINNQHSVLICFAKVYTLTSTVLQRCKNWRIVIDIDNIHVDNSHTTQRTSYRKPKSMECIYALHWVSDLPFTRVCACMHTLCMCACMCV